MSHVKLYVKAPQGQDNTPRRMRRADELVNIIGAMFNVPPNGDGFPVLREDGTYEVRVLDTSEFALGMARSALVDHEELEIVREEFHE